MTLAGEPRRLRAPALATERQLRFSIIVPTYNRLALLRETLDSIKVQDAGTCEIIVVDDGSTDGTANWLEAKAAEGSVRAIYQKNRGPSAARNAGAGAARAPWLVFLDSDDLWFPWTLPVLERILVQHPSLSLVAFSFIEFSDVQELPLSGTEYSIDVRRDYLSASSDGYFAGAGMWAIRREAFLGAGGFSENMCHAEDHDIALRLGTEPGFAMVTGPVMLGHRRHGAGLTDQLDGALGGIRTLIEREKAGCYPGGDERARERRRIVARHSRAAIMGALMAGRMGEARDLYRATFGWQLADGRIKFLAAAPAMALWRAARPGGAR